MQQSVLTAVVLFAAGVVAAEDTPLAGRLVALQAGDVACYADIEVAGEVQNRMAGFHVCAQEGLIGKQVRLGWEQASVLAADCEGDMDCGRSDSVQLIDRMIAEPVAAACAQSEQTAFSCRIGARQVSVCFVAGDEGPWLQYRFGRAGKAPEMLLPAHPTVPSHAAEGRVESFSGGAASWLRFKRADHAYVVYSGIGRWGEGGATRTQSGVVVERDGKAIASLLCDGAPNSRLDAHWYTAAGVKAAKNSAFAIPTKAK